MNEIWETPQHKLRHPKDNAKQILLSDADQIFARAELFDAESMLQWSPCAHTTLTFSATPVSAAPSAVRFSIRSQSSAHWSMARTSSTCARSGTGNVGHEPGLRRRFCARASATAC